MGSEGSGRASVPVTARGSKGPVALSDREVVPRPSSRERIIRRRVLRQYREHLTGRDREHLAGGADAGLRALEQRARAAPNIEKMAWIRTAFSPPSNGRQSTLERIGEFLQFDVSGLCTAGSKKDTR